MDGEASTGKPVMRYQSENFTLDTDDFSLTRNGISHPIEPQVFDLLIYLIEHRDRVVTREELLDALWHGRIVSDSAINARLKEARKAVGDTGKQQRVIKTIHRRGYQFIAEVNVSTADHQQQKSLSEKSVSKTEKPSIAVLKFGNLSNDPEQEYFSDGMATNICSCLSRIRALSVRFGIKHDLDNTSLINIAQELEVRYVLSGSVQREGDHVRVFVELTEGDSGDIKWSDQFDRRGTDVIDIQDDIAQAVTATLWSKRGTIREAERDKLVSKSTSDFNAFDYILKGIYYKEQYTAEALVDAHKCFDKAIELDPNCAEAYAWKAWIYLLEMWLGSSQDSEQSMQEALRVAKESVALDPYSEMGHMALSEVYSDLGDNRRALSEMEKALENNPNNPDLMIHKATMLCTAGQFDEAMKWYDRGFEFNRHFPNWYYWHYGIGLFAGHKWQDCVDTFNRMDEQNKDTLTYLSASYFLSGKQAEASIQFSELLRIDPMFDPLETKESHSYLAAETLAMMIDSLNQLFEQDRRQGKLRVVKS